MKLNEYTALSTANVLLVPYSARHVPEYHVWMQDAELQALTASEPLSIEEEHAMQNSWRDDHDKLTFIVCQPLAADPSRFGSENRGVRVGQDDGVERMIGDINLFLFEHDDEDDDNDNGISDKREEKRESTSSELTSYPSVSTSPLENQPDFRRDHVHLAGEIELMIARKSMQNRGFGRAALLTFLTFILDQWDAIRDEYIRGRANEMAAVTTATNTTSTIASGRRPYYLRVKINQDNLKSIGLFLSIGFRQISQANYFGEIELRWTPSVQRLREQKSWLQYERHHYA